MSTQTEQRDTAPLVPTERVCACGCGTSIEHMSVQARYLSNVHGNRVRSRNYDRPKNPPRPGQPILSTSVDPAVKAQVHAAAAANNESVSDLLRRAIDRALADSAGAEHALVLTGTAGGEPAAVALDDDTTTRRRLE